MDDGTHCGYFGCDLRLISSTERSRHIVVYIYKTDRPNLQLTAIRRHHTPLIEARSPKDALSHKGLSSQFAPQHFLNFLPLPHGQGSLRPMRGRLPGSGPVSPASRLA